MRHDFVSDTSEPGPSHLGCPQLRRRRPRHGRHAGRSGRDARHSSGCDMKPDAKIKTTDLEQALDYLEGLSLIMRSFDEDSRGREGRDMLLEGLQAMDLSLIHISEPT